MKALLVSEIFPPQHGGSGRWFWEVYSRLSKKDYVLAVGTFPGYKEFDKTHNLNIEREDLSSNAWGLMSFQGLKYYLKTFFHLRKLIKKHQIEQLHCGRCLPEGVMAYIIHQIYGIPYKCFIHGEDVETAALSRELSWMLYKVFSKASMLICNSQNSADILTDKWKVNNNKVTVLHPGVDSTRFLPAPKNQKTKDSLSWDTNTVVLTVGRLQERKGHDMMIKALVEIKKQIPDILYAIIGDGDRRDYLLSLTEELGLTEHVMFMGEVNDEVMIQCYQQCDLFVLPNRTVDCDMEGFGMVLVEAQSCGKPVLAGDSGGTKETMIEAVTGYTIDCRTPLKLTEYVTKLLADDKDNHTMMGVAAREHVKDNLDWGNLANKAEHIFLDS